MFGSWIQPYRGCSFGGCVHLGGDFFYRCRHFKLPPATPLHCLLHYEVVLPLCSLLLPLCSL